MPERRGDDCLHWESPRDCESMDIKDKLKRLVAWPVRHSPRNRTESMGSNEAHLRHATRNSIRMEVLEASAAHRQEVISNSLPSPPDQATHLRNLSSTLLNRFNQIGGMEYSDTFIEYLQETLQLLPPSHPAHSMALTHLGAALWGRFNQTGRMEDLEMSIECQQEALNLQPPGHPVRSLTLNNLSIAVSRRFDHMRRIEDLELSIGYLREALIFHPAGHPIRPESIFNLATALWRRFDQRGRMEDLEMSLKYFQEALGLQPPGHPNRPKTLNGFAAATGRRFDQMGRIEDLETSIEYFWEALSLAPSGHPYRTTTLNNLAYGIFRRFDQMGRLEDLEMVIEYLQESLSLQPPEHPQRSISLNNLASSILKRSEQTGRMEDLEKSIEYIQEALSLQSPGHPIRSLSLNNLASSVRKRFDLTGRVEDLEMSIKYLQEAIRLEPPGHPQRSLSLVRLASFIIRSFDNEGKMEDLEKSLTYLEEALSLQPPGHPHRSPTLTSLASAIGRRFDRTGRMDDLQTSIRCCQEALSLRPTDHPDRSIFVYTLGLVLLKRFHQTRNAQDYHNAFKLVEEAANCQSASTKTRFESAVLWAYTAHGYRHESTMRAYSMVLSLLDQYLIVYPTIESQQKFLASKAIPKSLAANAASAAIEAGQLEPAVQILEQGRAMLWSRMRGYRHPLDELRQSSPELADELEALSVRLEHLAMSSESESNLSSSLIEHEGEARGTSVPIDVKQRQVRILSEKRDAVIEKIRRISGFQDLLKTVPFRTLQNAACGGPVIIVNISTYRSDAIIVQHLGDPVLVTLPDASLDQLNQLSSELPGGNGASSVVFPILRALWRIVVLPIVNQLAKLGVAKNSRIWWSLTSELCVLPLHAAGPYKSGHKNLPDLYISSYTSTLSALVATSSGSVRKTPNPRLLIIGQSETLPMVEDEIFAIRQFGNFVNVLSGDEANKYTVLSGLRQHSWVHFACHGRRDNQPFQSSFELYAGERLTLLDLIQAKLPDAELAFLSACHAAAADMGGTPDEFIHLAGALQFCGFRSVVGTLWAMADMDGPDVARDFYQHMFYEIESEEKKPFADFRDAAAALNFARRMMRKNRVPLSRWINFVHIGA